MKPDESCEPSPSPGFRVSVIGAGACDDQTYEEALKLGIGLAQRNCTVICGGLDGVMRAVCEGAAKTGGTTIGILPGSDPKNANPFVQISIATSLSHMRNFLVVLNGDIVIAVQGEFGTLSELALARKSGKTVITIGKWSGIPGVLQAENAEDALRLLDQRLPLL